MENVHHIASAVKPALIVKPISPLRLTFWLKEFDLIIFSCDRYHWTEILTWREVDKAQSLAMVCHLDEIKALPHQYFLPQHSWVCSTRTLLHEFHVLGSSLCCFVLQRMLLPEIMFHRKIKGGQEVCLSFVKWEKGQCENGGGKG